MAVETLEHVVDLNPTPGQPAPLEPVEQPVAAQPDEEKITVEVVDDRPPEDQRAPKKAGVEPKGAITDDEVSQLGPRVQKRIKQQTYEINEERRQKESAQKERDEAVFFAQGKIREAEELRRGLLGSHQAVITTANAKVDSQLEQARREYKEAFEASDGDKMALAQEKLANLAVERNDLRRLTFEPPPRPEQQPRQEAQPRQQVQPKISDRTEQWIRENAWYIKDQAAAQYASQLLHPHAVKTGLVPDSEEYWSYIETETAKNFPEHFQNRTTPEQAPRKLNGSGPPIAGVTRVNGASGPRIVKLTTSQASLAKRFGLTTEQYAKELLRMENEG